MFEREREEMTDEIHHLQQEVRNLSNQLREKENIIQLKDKADSWRTPQQGELLMTVEVIVFFKSFKSARIEPGFILAFAFFAFLLIRISNS